MRILSINFGHDASLALFESGKLIEFEELERQSRLRYHFGIRAEYIDQFLGRSGSKFADIDIVAICSTQWWAMAHCEEIVLNRGWSEEHRKFCDYFELWQDDDFWVGSGTTSYYEKHLELQHIKCSTPSPGRREYNFPFLRGPRIDQTELIDLVDSTSSLGQENLRKIKANFLCPYSFGLRSTVKPAFYVDHHTCHANYAHFYSGAKSSIVSTLDGAGPWMPFNSGGVYLSDSERGIVPLVSHNLALGHMYDQITNAVGLHGDVGKLMGLSAYANPSPDTFDLIRECLTSYSTAEQIRVVWERLLAISANDQSIRGRSMRMFHFDLPDANLAAQAAANVQSLVQHLFVNVIGRIARTICEARSDLACLDLTGGFTLNCPSNYLLQQNSTFKVNPLPGAGDTGLAVGAAVALNDFLHVPVDRQIDANGLVAAFPPSSINYNDAGARLESVESVDINKDEMARFISDRLLEGSVLCIHRGRSEVGPRALGRRSIIAHAVSGSVRDRINSAKGREPWRPLAPICRREDFHDYFEGDVAMGRFMLFTCRVLNDGVPAVTHVDGTARVQCVDESDDWLHPALGYLKSAGCHPIIVNTSFNCAGEPIVETLDHAINSFLRLGFEYLVTEVGVFRPKRV